MTCASPTFSRAAARLGSKPCRAARRTPPLLKMIRGRRGNPAQCRRSLGATASDCCRFRAVAAQVRSVRPDLRRPALCAGLRQRGRQVGGQAGWLAPGGWLSVETSRDDRSILADLTVDAVRDVGRARLTLLRRP